MSLNRISVMGRIGKDLELRRTQSGKAVTSFPIAVDRDGNFALPFNSEGMYRGWVVDGDLNVGIYSD